MNLLYVNLISVSQDSLNSPLAPGAVEILRVGKVVLKRLLERTVLYLLLDSGMDSCLAISHKRAITITTRMTPRTAQMSRLGEMVNPQPCFHLQVDFFLWS